jgi:predicted GTPase
MVYDYSDLIEQAKQWALNARALGWINVEMSEQLSAVDVRAPDALFSATSSLTELTTRPLVVAFMGGTGVGKSTLLNRLAAKNIAKAGVVRPTSREVTLYHHESVVLRHFPEQSLNQINISTHHDLGNKNVVWIDMPDFDSTEQTNKHLVLHWLPYIDVLIYVVSPERYKDEKAWRLLLAEGTRHAWLFAFNQWDRGQSDQYADFTQQLQSIGFVEPVIFKTACSEDNLSDEFEVLASTINSLATSHIIEQLELRGSLVRKQALKYRLEQVMIALGPDDAYQKLTEKWQAQWQATVTLLQKGFEWPLKYKAEYYAEHAADIMTQSVKSEQSVWDTWAQARFDDALDELMIYVDQLGIPVLPFKQLLGVLKDTPSKMVLTQTELATRVALANPGNVLQRFCLKSLRLAEIILPLTSMSWVGYKVLMSYYLSNMTNDHYLGVDFAVHSSLLIALSWLMPFFILKKMQPSLKKTALKGLNKGLANAFNLIDERMQMELNNKAKQHKEQVSQLLVLINACEVSEYTSELLADKENPLARLLMH